MTLDELTHYFRFQTTETEDYKPTGRLEYQMFESATGSKITAYTTEKDLSALLETIDKNGYSFEGYRDRTPYFVKPEVHVLL